MEYRVYGGSSDGEQVTPTGAGIIASIAREFGPAPPMKIDRVGYGSGSRENRGMPNLLRIFYRRANGRTVADARGRSLCGGNQY